MSSLIAQTKIMKSRFLLMAVRYCSGYSPNLCNIGCEPWSIFWSCWCFSQIFLGCTICKYRTCADHSASTWYPWNIGYENESYNVALLLWAWFLLDFMQEFLLQWLLPHCLPFERSSHEHGTLWSVVKKSVPNSLLCTSFEASLHA